VQHLLLKKVKLFLKSEVLCGFWYNKKMKLTYENAREAAQLNARGVTIDSLSHIFNVAPNTMAKYIRAYERYGKSFWSRYPTEETRND